MPVRLIATATLFMALIFAAQTQAAKIAPDQQPEQKKIEVVFVLDTTGSMSGLISAAKDKIWSLASSMANAKPAPVIRMGLVGYRDRGDQYVTRITPLSNDIDRFYGDLMQFAAEGGGDSPESVNQALDEAVNKINWSNGQDTYRVIFLVGDWSPHMDYSDDVKYNVSCKKAKRMGIIINTVQCGAIPDTEAHWRVIAQMAGGEYFQLGQEGNGYKVSTPYDKKMAEISARLDGSKLYYGSPMERTESLKRKEMQLEISKKLEETGDYAAAARRSTFNALKKSGAANFYGHNELLNDLHNNKVSLDSISGEMLPPEMRSMNLEERRKYIALMQEARARMLTELTELGKKRQLYITTENSKPENARAVKDSISQNIFNVITEQAKEKADIQYESTTVEH